MPSPTATITITTIPTQTAGVPFQVTATYVLTPGIWQEQLQYADAATATPIPVPASATVLSTSSITFSHPGNLAPGTHTVTIKDRLTGASATSNSFLVVGGKVITPATPSGVVQNQSFSFTGSLSGYTSTVALTWQLDGGALVSFTSTNSTSFATPITVTTAGAHVLHVSDGSVTGQTGSFTVSPVTVNHVITPSVPASVTAGATFAFTGTLAGYTTAPTLTYTINNSVPQSVTGVSSTGWSMNLVAPTAPSTYNLAVTDGTTSQTVTLNVIAAAKVITPLAPSGTVAGQSFTFTGVLSGYTTIPALSYTISPGGTLTPMTGISVTGWAMTVTLPTAGSFTVAVSDGTVTSQAVAFSVAPASVPTVTRKWYQNYGQNGSFWVQPFQNTANWITSGTLITALRGGTPSVNLRGNFATPTYIGQATDPIVTVTDGTNSIVVHIPAGAVIETPDSAVDNSIGGTDMTKPYLVWSISGAKIFNAANTQISSVQGSGCVIRGTYGLAVQDGAGLIMVDAVTGQPGDGNANGLIQEYELSQILADSNYVIQHMLQFQLDVGQASSAGPIWPLKIIDGGAIYTGVIPQGITVGIPSNVARPTGMTRGKAVLWDVFQQFGGFNYNFGATGGVNIEIYNNNSAYNSLVSDMVTSWPSVATQLCILNYANGVSGAQYSLATTKGAIAGSTNAYPPPPPLDLSPTGGVNVAPNTFGAWYPSGYNVTPNNTSTGAQFIVSPNTPVGVVAGTPFAFTGVLSGFSSPPTLTYSVNGAAAVALTGVTATGWNALLTVAAAGATTIVVTDTADAASGSTSFTANSTIPTANPVTWNSADVIGMTLSSGNTVATATGSATPYASPQGVRATAPISQGQIVLWEEVFSSVTQNVAVGVADADYLLNLHAGLGGDNNGIGAYPSTGTGSQPAQTVYYNSAQLTAGNGVNSVAPFPVTLAVNGTNLFFSDPAMRSTSGVVWNNSTTADPAANIGGLSFSGISLPFFPVYTTGEAGSSAALNDGSAAFSAFASNYLAAHPAVVTLSGQQPVTPTKAIAPDSPSGVVVGASFTFTGSLTGYATPPTLTYALNGASAVALAGVTATGWSATLVSQVSGSNTIVVSDGTISNQVSFTVNTPGTGTINRVTAPLTGTVAKGTWVLGKQFALANSPSGKGYMQYNYLLPAQYNPALVYPILFVGHPLGSGMINGTYPRDGSSFTTNLSYGGSFSLDTLYNNVTFRTAHPCILVACECDQSIDQSGSNGNANFGGYNDSQNSGWNENAVNGIVQSFISGSVVQGLQVDPGARYHIGYSLGGIGTLAYLVDNNIWNGPGLRIWTAGATFSDQLFRPGTPNSAVFGRMASVPLLTCSQTSDNVPTSYDIPAWQSYTGNSNYPTKATYDAGGVAACRAGTTNYYYINNGSGNTATAFMPMNEIGGDGTRIYAWLFSQVSGATSPTITGVTFNPNSPVLANSPTNTVAGGLVSGSANGALTGISYSISPSTNFKISGTNVQFAASNVAVGTYPLTVTVNATNASNSPQSYTINILVTSGSLPSGIFKVSGGQVLKPDGSVFTGRGVAFWDNQFQGGVTNAACQPLLTLFPKTNIVRLARVSDTFWTPATYAQQINWLTAKGIVVCIENHKTSNGSSAGGGQGVVYSGTLLSQEQAWYQSLANYFKDNTYVWFGTNNEPPIDPSLLALWQWQQTTYNTIRATGNTSIVEIEQYNPYLQGALSGLSSTFWTQMTSIVWGPHYYSWIWNGNGSTAVPQSTMYNGPVGGTNSKYGGIVQMVANLQTLRSGDGIVPVGCFEYGPSTTGTGVDAGGMNCVGAVHQAVNAGNLFASMAWLWGNIGNDNLQNSSGGVQSPYGTTVASYILANT